MLLLKRPLCFCYRHCPGKRAETAMRGRYLGPAALIGPHGAIWWKSILVCHCTPARSHARRSGSRVDGRRQLDRAAGKVPENDEDLTSQPGPPPPVEVPTDPPREPEEPSPHDLDIGMEAVEQMTPLEETRETESSTEIGRVGNTRISQNSFTG